MYLLTQAQVDAITAAKDNVSSSTPWADMYTLIHSIIQQPDALGNGAAGNAVAWFGAAAQANQGVGGASVLIRSYTEAQLEFRTGNQITNIDSVLQAHQTPSPKRCFSTF